MKTLKLTIAMLLGLFLGNAQAFELDALQYELIAAQNAAITADTFDDNKTLVAASVKYGQWRVGLAGFGGTTMPFASYEIDLMGAGGLGCEVGLARYDQKTISGTSLQYLLGCFYEFSPSYDLIVLHTSNGAALPGLDALLNSKDELNEPAEFVGVRFKF